MTPRTPRFHAGLAAIAGLLCLSSAGAFADDTPGFSAADSARIRDKCSLLLAPDTPEAFLAGLCEQCLRDLGELTELEAQILAEKCPGLDPSAIDDRRVVEPLDEPQWTGWGIFFDNDMWTGSDENYTMGLTFQCSGAHVRTTRPLKWMSDGLRWVDRRSPLDGRHNARPEQGNVVLFGHTAFTPRDIGNPAPIPGDRPYASMLYLTVKRSSGASTGPMAQRRTAYRSELTLGWLGLGVGEYVQTKIHRSLRKIRGEDKPIDPEGWANQISEGGEPTAGYSFGAQRLVSNSSWHDMTWSWEGALGYYTHTGIGSRARLGRIRTPFWRFEGNPNQSYDQALRSQPWELFVWGAVRGRAWGYNAFMQGQFKGNNPVEVSAGDVERFVLDGQVGAAWNFCNVGLSAAVTARTAEFEGPNARSHVWSGVYLSYRGRS